MTTEILWVFENGKVFGAEFLPEPVSEQTWFV